ncbi:hypothetical protein F4803DRAFT_577420 [Xylaria telfairii]|nr:hypothetical protein F4803DRAFT_577420 [Xylaria telfairii]
MSSSTMPSSTSSCGRPLPYDPVRPSDVGEAPKSPLHFTFPEATNYLANFPDPLEPLLGERFENLFQDLRALNRELEMRGMVTAGTQKWIPRWIPSPGHSQAEAQILEQNKPDYTRVQNIIHSEQSSLNSIGNEVYADNIDPRLEQMYVAPNYAGNYNPSQVEDNSANHAGIDAYYDVINPLYDDIDALYDGIDPLYEQENIPPNSNYDYPYGATIIPRQIAPLQESLLNSNIVFPMLGQQVSFPELVDPLQADDMVKDFLSVADPSLLDEVEPHSNYPISPLLKASNDRNHSKGRKRFRIWEDDDDDDEAAYTTRPRKAARWESPQIKMEPGDDDDDESYTAQLRKALRWESPEIKAEPVEDGQDHYVYYPTWDGN